MSIVQDWLKRTLGHEGGYSNHPSDPGGETRWGICKRSYPMLDIKSLTVEHAEEIYIRDFLAPLQWRRYSDGVAFQLFDFAVNSGFQTAIKRLQREIGAEDDGLIGDETISKIRAMSESDLVMLIIASRIEYMTDLKTWRAFCRGWMKRIAQNLRYGALDS